MIKKNINGKNKSIAIECRDYTAKNDITWIDSLVGKYKNLRTDINEIIAVSKSGFSESAEIKAKFEGIELRTLEHAENIDWKEKFRKLGMIQAQYEIKFFNLSLDIYPLPDITKFSLDIDLFDEKETNYGTIYSFCQSRTDQYIREKLLEEFNEESQLVVKTRVDYDCNILFEKAISNLNFHFFHAGITYYLRKIILQFKAIPHVVEIKPDHFQYDEALVDEFKFNLDDHNQIQKFYISQFPNVNKVNVHSQTLKKPFQKKGNRKGREKL